MNEEMADLLIIVGIILAVVLSAYGILWFSGETACQNLCQEHYAGKFSQPPLFGTYPPAWKCETKNAVIDGYNTEDVDADGWEDGYKYVQRNYCAKR